MEKFFLVGAHLKQGGTKIQQALDSLGELARLTETAGGEVVGQTLQSLDAPQSATWIGKGKVEELRDLARQKKFSALAFDQELKPAQMKNLAEIIPVKILDRTRIILDIFAKRARTKEGILQVELAQLSYHLPRMTERYGRFEQQVGGIGTRGPGERKLEVEARHIRDRMSALKKQIESIKLHREIARERRTRVPLPIITIVGYTNAGKSTLLNTLAQMYGESKDPVYADDKLFATLDPTTRRIRLPSGRWALFTDTVGFIKKLPTHLIAAFRATLEETLNADILIHLIDANDPNQQEHEKTVLNILRELKPDEQNLWDKQLVVYNKIDQITQARKNQLMEASAVNDARTIEPLGISATRKIGIANLIRRIEEKLSRKMVSARINVPFKKLNLLPSLYRLGQVESVEHHNTGARITLKLEKSHWAKLRKLLKKTD